MFDTPCVEMAGRKKCGSGVYKESRKVKVFHEWEQQRKNRHVWMKMSHKITDEEHASFCTSLSNASEDEALQYCKTNCIPCVVVHAPPILC